jgi:hypothetical protein
MTARPKHKAEVDENCHQREGVQHQVVEPEAIVLQQCEEEGGHQEVKKMNSLGHKPPSGMVLHCILPSYSVDYHPSSHHNRLRPLSV